MSVELQDVEAGPADGSNDRCLRSPEDVALIHSASPFRWWTKRNHILRVPDTCPGDVESFGQAEEFGQHETPAHHLERLRQTLLKHLKPSSHVPTRPNTYHFTPRYTWMYVGDGDRLLRKDFNWINSHSVTPTSPQDWLYLKKWVEREWPADLLTVDHNYILEYDGFEFERMRMQVALGTGEYPADKANEQNGHPWPSWISERSSPWTRGEVVYMSVSHSRLAGAPLEFFASLNLYDRPFYEPFVVNARSFYKSSIYDTGPVDRFREYIGKEPYKGVTCSTFHDDVRIKDPSKTGDSDLVTIVQTLVGHDVVYKQRYFVRDYFPQWDSVTREEHMGSKVNYNWEQSLGFYTFRQVTRIGKGLERVHLREVRSSVRLVMRNFHSNFHITVLNDRPLRGPSGIKEHWSALGLKPSNDGTGITQFLAETWDIFDESADSWDGVLDSLDEVSRVSLYDFARDDYIEELMFDTSMERSKSYFCVLQILRMIEEWTRENLTGFESIRKNGVFEAHSFRQNAQTEENLALIEGKMQSRVESILQRVRSKKEEIQSLRDGLFNATSLRETTKGMALNQAIYIFTVVTVLFTPVSFLATFWALPFLNNPRETEDNVPEPSAFRSSFIALPLLTYGLVFMVAWVAAPSHHKFAFKRMLRSVIGHIQSISGARRRQAVLVNAKESLRRWMT